GVLEMARALRAGVPHRAQGEIAAHVLDVMVGIETAIAENSIVEIDSRFTEVEPMPADCDPYAATPATTAPVGAWPHRSPPGRERGGRRLVRRRPSAQARWCPANSPGCFPRRPASPLCRSLIRAISSSVSSSSREAKFETIRSGVTDFGITTLPSARFQLI